MREKIKKAFADKIIAKYKDYGITTTTEYWSEKYYPSENEVNFEGICLMIKNPHGEDIRILYDGNHVPDEIIFSCERHHTHFSHFYVFDVEREEEFADYYVENISSAIDKILKGIELGDVFL